MRIVLLLLATLVAAGCMPFRSNNLKLASVREDVRITKHTQRIRK
jgi:hypothetical protein